MPWSVPIPWGWTRRYSICCAKQDTPLIGPFTLDPGDAFVNAAAFYLYPGFVEQARALADEAFKAASADKPVVLIGPEGAHVDRLVQAVQQQQGERSTESDVTVRYPRGEMDVEALAERVTASASDTLFFFGDQADLELLLAALGGAGAEPARLSAVGVRAALAVRCTAGV